MCPALVECMCPREGGEDESERQQTATASCVKAVVGVHAAQAQA